MNRATLSAVFMANWSPVRNLTLSLVLLSILENMLGDIYGVDRLVLEASCWHRKFPV